MCVVGVSPSARKYQGPEPGAWGVHQAGRGQGACEAGRQAERGAGKDDQGGRGREAVT